MSTPLRSDGTKRRTQRWYKETNEVTLQHIDLVGAMILLTLQTYLTGIAAARRCYLTLRRAWELH